MVLIRMKRGIATCILPKIRRYSTPTTQSDEYAATPEYPPILDLSFEKKTERKREASYEELKQCKTIEEKQIKLNMPRYYGFKTYMLSESPIPYNSLHLAQHVTKTHIVETKEFPQYYDGISTQNIEQICNDIQEALLLEIDGTQKLHDLKNDKITDTDREDIISSCITKSINRVFFNHLARQSPHIIDNQIDLEPRIESSWVVGGINPDKRMKSIRNGLEYMRPFKDDPIDRHVCYLSKPSLTVRSKLPLPCIIAPKEAENPDLNVPFFQYDPRVLGLGVDHRHAANIPGFWPGDSHAFGIIQFVNTGHMLERRKFISDEIDNQEALKYQAILSSYAWLHAQANFLGFTTYNDITYPLVTQTILTNGKQFNLYAYQLNTITLHSKLITENPKKNICWAVENMNLYQEVNEGKIIGFNEEVVKLISKFYQNEPQERVGVNLTPYLSREEKIIADYADDDKRKWLEKHYKFIVSNRPRHREIDEIYQWERIYKIDHKTRLMEKRRRFFELFQQPWKKTLDSLSPQYIPRALRPDLPRHKGRYAKDYWP